MTGAVFEVVPGALSLDVIAPVVLFLVSLMVPITFTLAVQDVPRDNWTPAIVKFVAPAATAGLKAPGPQPVI